jgi:hypothetical protein
MVGVGEFSRLVGSITIVTLMYVLGIDPGWENQAAWFQYGDQVAGGKNERLLPGKERHQDVKVWEAAEKYADKWKCSYPAFKDIVIETQYKGRAHAILQQSLYGSFRMKFPNAKMHLVHPRTMKSKMKIGKGKDGNLQAAAELGFDILSRTQHEVDAFLLVEYLKRHVLK